MSDRLIRAHHVKGLSGCYTRQKAESGVYEVFVNERRVGVVRKMGGSKPWRASRGGVPLSEPFALLHEASDWCASLALGGV